MPLFSYVRCSATAAAMLSRSGNRHAAVDDDGLPSHIASRLRCQQNCGAGDLVRLADAAKRRLFVPSFEIVRIFPQRARKVGADEARSDAVDADIVRSKLDGKIAGELQIRGLGDAIGT